MDPGDFLSPRISPDPVDLTRLRAWDCLVGHFEESGIYLHERYPDVLRSPDWFLFTFVRHPLWSRARTASPRFEDGFLEEFERQNRVDYAIYRHALEEWGAEPSRAGAGGRNGPSVDDPVPARGAGGDQAANFLRE